MEKKNERETTSSSMWQLKAVLRKNWRLKIRHPLVTCGEILLPTIVMLLLIAVRMQVDRKIHPSQPVCSSGYSTTIVDRVNQLLADTKIYKDEAELETYIRSDIYGAYDKAENFTNPKIKGAIVFHEQGPQSFDYGIRLNHAWLSLDFLMLTPSWMSMVHFSLT